MGYHDEGGVGTYSRGSAQKAAVSIGADEGTAMVQNLRLATLSHRWIEGT